MAMVYKLYVGIIITDTTDTGPWNGHFSECPEELAHYCVHGECRYVKEQKAPSCRCQHGYIGSRCEYVDLDWRRGEKRQIIIACVIAVLVILILLIIFIGICSQRSYRLCRRRGRRREEPRNGSEKLSMMDTGAMHTILTPDSIEPPQPNAEVPLCAGQDGGPLDGGTSVDIVCCVTSSGITLVPTSLKGRPFLEMSGQR